MTFAEKMNAIALNVRLCREAERKAEAETIFNSFKSTIKHFASLGQMSTSITIPLEYKGAERAALGPALREVFIENGFKVKTIARDRFQISWEKVD